MTAITNMLSFQQERRELMNYLRKCSCTVKKQATENNR